MDAFEMHTFGQGIHSHYEFTTDDFTRYALLIGELDIRRIGPERTRANFPEHHTEHARQLHAYVGATYNSSDSALLAKCHRKDSSQADRIPVNVTSYTIRYVCKPRELLVAYGLSFFCALACTLLGLHAFFIKGASYQENFSTFVRVLADQELHSMIDPGDDGADPVPRDLAEARITVTGRREGCVCTPG